MTSRERVKNAVNHIEPDQVPVDFGGYRSSGIMALAYKKLRDHLGLPKKTIKIYDIIQQLALIDEDVLERFGVDTLDMGQGFARSDSDWKEWVMPDGTDVLIPAYIDVEKRNGDWILKAPSGIDAGIQREGMIYFDQIYWPYSEGVPKGDFDIAEGLSHVMWSVPTPPDLGLLTPENITSGAKNLYESTDKFIIFIFGGNLLEIACFLCGIEQFYILLGTEPETVHHLLDTLVEHHIKNIDTYLPLVAPYIDIMLFSDDLGMQQGPQISPAMYKEFFKPRHEKVWKYAKKLGDVPLKLHSCGGIRPLLDDIIDAGMDAVNPVQTNCDGMEPAGLKKDFGDRVVLWGGGCDTAHILPKGSPGEVREHVIERCRILQPGGGFIFQQVHNIMANVPPENIVAMFDAVSEFNRSR
jgi:uroporphyrinogen decarboxylase